MRWILFSLVFVFGCSQKQSPSNTSESKKTDVRKLIISVLGDQYKEYYNTDSTHLLAVQEQGTSPMIKYIVVDVATSSIIKQDSFKPGYVKWKDNTSLEVLSAPGTIPKDKNLSDYIRIVNLKPTSQQ